jgi:hypothetical protein
MDGLRDAIADLVRDSMGDPDFYDVTDSETTADRILALVREWRDEREQGTDA